MLLSEVAVEDLDQLIVANSLPSDARDRVKRSLRILERFPQAGSKLSGRWDRFRFVLGPWRWMLFVYLYDEDGDRVIIVTVQDARSATSATTSQ